MSHDDVQGNNVNVLSWNFLAMYFLSNHAGEFFFVSFWGIIVWCATLRNTLNHTMVQHFATRCATLQHTADAFLPISLDQPRRRVPSTKCVQIDNAKPRGCPTSAHILAAALRMAMPSSHRQRRFAAYSGPCLSSP
jgi:hypothetical protein